MEWNYIHRGVCFIRSQLLSKLGCFAGFEFAGKSDHWNACEPRNHQVGGGFRYGRKVQVKVPIGITDTPVPVVKIGMVAKLSA